MASPLGNLWKAVFVWALIAVGGDGNAQESHPTIRARNTCAFVHENDTRGTNVAFKITLSRASDRPISVKYSTTDGTATAPSDYTSISGTLIFPPGATEQNLTVHVNGNTANEPNETFYLDLTEPIDARLETPRVNCDIYDNNPAPTVTIDDTRVVEGDEPFTVSAFFKLHLSFPSEQFVLVDMQTISGTAHEMNFNDPTPGESDYYGTFGSAAFAPGETETEIEVQLNSDTFPESDETFSVVISSNNAQVTRTSAVATIVDDDTLPAVSIKGVSGRELSYASTNFQFEVTLSKPSDSTVLVMATTKTGSAIAGIDFEAATSFVIFAPGETNHLFTVEVLPDQVQESPKTFSVLLSSPENAVLGVAQAEGEILDAVNEVPNISITSPLAANSFIYPANVSLTANATDLDGTIQRVEFWVNNQKIGEATQQPFSVIWASPLPSQYTVTARAFDNNGAGSSSEPLTITVISDAKVKIASPPQDSAFSAGDAITFSADVDSEVMASRVEFWADGAQIGSADSAPYSFALSNAPLGVHLVVAKAFSGTDVVESAPVRFTVVVPRPANDMFANATELAGFSPESNASNVGATTEPGELPHGTPAAGASVWWKWMAPGDGALTITTTNSPIGHYFIAIYSGETVTNLDLVGAFQDFGTITVTNGFTYRIAIDGVNDQTGPVSLQLALSAITISAPAQQSVFTAPAQIPFTIAGNDGGAAVQAIELRQGPQSLGKVSGPPFQFTWTNAPNGYYQVYAVGKDRLGGVRESAAVFLTVKPQNDDFENAIWLSGYSTNIHTANYGATMQVTTLPGQRRDGEATGLGDNQGGHSIWYNWTAPDDGLVSLNGQGANFPLLLSASVGDDVLHLGRIAVNATTPLPVVFTARKGVLYRISVDCLEGQQGELDWSLSLHPHNDDFANRTVFTGSSYETFATPQGSATEPFEVPLKYPTNSVSLWWSWAAPAPGSVTISATSETALTQLFVCTGDPFALATVRKTTAWSTNSTVTFTAQAGKLYHFAVLSQSGSTDTFSVRLFLDILQLTSPNDGAVFEAPAAVPLSVSKFGGLSNIVRVDYLVNGVVAISSSNAPYSATWTNSVPGNYVITAKAVLPTSSSIPSLGHSIQLYENRELPQPRLIQNVEYGDELWVINAVGSIFALGNSAPTFGAPATGLNQLPTQGKWPAGVHNWREISCVNSFQDSHTWSLTDDGVLYKDNQTKIPFPPGVTKWLKLTAGATTVGDDGNFYQVGSNLVTRLPGGVAWKDAGGYNYFYTLAVDGRLFLQGKDNFNNPIATQIPFPAGVIGWSEMKMGVYGGILRASDGALYRIGSAIGNNPTGPEPVPLPPGVTRFTSFTTGNLHFLAIGDDGELYAWGYNMSGQLGIGSSYLETTNLQKVIKPPGVTGWMAVGAGRIHSAALGNDCSLYVWGSNDFGQLALGPVLSQTVPMRVDNLGSLCGIPVIFTKGSDSQLPNGAFGIRFPTDLNRAYTIQYSDDITTWKSAFPNVIGTGDFLDWIDSGPPITETAPNEQGQRFYRAIFAQ